MSWYVKAAEAGDVNAMRTIANRFYEGISVPKSASEAVSWYKKAALAGDARSMDWLGMWSSSIGPQASSTTMMTTRLSSGLQRDASPAIRQHVIT